jgi:hypothetical protein
MRRTVRESRQRRATSPEPTDAPGRLIRMSSERPPFADQSLERAIELRWTLRDIQTDRLSLMPASDEDLNVLTELGLVEFHDGVPVVTSAGIAFVESTQDVESTLELAPSSPDDD